MTAMDRQRTTKRDYNRELINSKTDPAWKELTDAVNCDKIS